MSGTRTMRSWVPRLASAVWIVDLALIAGGALLAYREDDLDFYLFFAPAALLYATLGSRIVVRQNGNQIGWLLLSVGTGISFEAATIPLVSTLMENAPGVGRYVAWVSDWAFIPTIGPLALVFLLFPDGRPPSRRWRKVGWTIVGGVTTAWVAFALTPGPLNSFSNIPSPVAIPGAEAVLGTIVAIATIMTLAASFSTAFALRGRYKRAEGEERQQIRWLAAVGGLAGVLLVIWVITLLASVAMGWEGTSGNLDYSLIPLALLVLTIGIGVPVAVSIAIFRYRLWELDVIVKKAVVAFILASLIGAVLGLILLGGVFGFVGVGDELAPIAVGIAIGLLFVPLRRIARRLADRVVFGSRATPYEALTAFSSRMGETYSTEDVLPRMAQILGEATGAKSVHVWLRVGERFEAATVWPSDAPLPPSLDAPPEGLPMFDAGAWFEVRDRGDLLGALTLTLSASDPMNPRKESLARDLAAQAGLVLRNVRLIEDLRESRRRIVSAQDERARALERDIHDGAQQQLVALSVKLRLAEGLVERDPVGAQQLLGELQHQTTETLEDLRDLARGIYPPLLADRGLPAALEAQARKAPLPVTIQPDGVGRYDSDVESAVYFCCLEALNNVAKYADATSVEIRLAHADGELRFEVADDGRGFDPRETGYGTGLRGMADRLEAIGGTLQVRSDPGAGTTVTGRLRVEASTR